MYDAHSLGGAEGGAYMISFMVSSVSSGGVRFVSVPAMMKGGREVFTCNSLDAVSWSFLDEEYQGELEPKWQV